MSIEVSRSQRNYKPQADHQPKSKMSAANDELAMSRISQLRMAAQDQKSLFSFPALVLVLMIHALAIFGLLSLNPTPDTEVKVPEAAPMMVSLVSEPAPEPEPEVAEIIPKPEPKPVIKKPKPIPKKIVEPTPIPEEIPEPVEMAPAPAEPEQEIVSAPAPAPVVAKQEAPKPEPVVEEVIEPPKFGAAYLHNPPPAYPALSRRVGEEGRVMLRVLVSKNGDAQQVEIESGSGSSRLDKAALEAVKNWRFIPAKRNNQPISAYVIVPIQFTLNS